MIRPASALRWVGLAALLTACPIGNNKYPKPADLSPAWRIDKLRVLAVRADPPEVAVGEEARFEALVTDPEGRVGAVVWLACPPDDAGGIGFGCGLDGGFDFTEATPDELADQGFIGFEPFVPPRYTPPADTLEGTSETEARQGVYTLIQVAVLPQEVLDGGFDGADFDFNQVEVAYKRLRVSTNVDPNQNPSIVDFYVDDVPLGGAVLEVDPGETYRIEAELGAGSVEAYTYQRDADSPTEVRVEEPYATWYADGGEVLATSSLHPNLVTRWRAPELDSDDPTEGTFWAVVRDRRGGMNWASLSWRLRGTAPGETDAE